MIQLNEVEKKIVEHVARKRYQQNRLCGAQATYYKDVGDEEAAIREEMQHYGGEIAFHKMHNTYPDFGYEERKGGGRVHAERIQDRCKNDRPGGWAVVGKSYGAG